MSVILVQKSSNFLMIKFHYLVSAIYATSQDRICIPYISLSEYALVVFCIYMDEKISLGKILISNFHKLLKYETLRCSAKERIL